MDNQRGSSYTVLIAMTMIFLEKKGFMGQCADHYACECMSANVQ